MNVREKDTNRDSAEQIDKETILKIKQLLSEKIPKTEFKTPNTFIKYYSLPVGLLLISFAIVLTMFFIGVKIVYIILVSIILFPIALLVLGYMTLRLLFWDKHKVTGTILKALSKNFLIVNFFQTQKRSVKRVVQLSEDGISFMIGKSRYMVDSDCIYMDENNYPNSYYVPNLPNPLKFDFEKQLKLYADMLRNPMLSNMELKDSKGELVDVTYSSKNLEIFKKDKIFFEFHQQTTPETMKIIYILLGLVAIETIFLLILGLRKPTATPTEETVKNIILMGVLICQKKKKY